MNWYLEVLKKYAEFKGRAGRQEYWWFAFFNLIIFIALLYVDAWIGLAPESNLGFLAALYGLAVLLPGVAVKVRRLHDTGRSGWWNLVCLVPLIGPIVWLVFMMQEGQHGRNQYGPNPAAESRRRTRHGSSA